jgi:hypothetical protein
MDAADRAARQMGVSRGRLFSLAVQATCGAANNARHSIG